MKEIIQKDNPLLRKKADMVPLADIGSGKITKIIRDMTSAMYTQKDGIAIAAPQIGVSMQIFVVSGRMLKVADKDYAGSEDEMVFINPKIKKVSKKKVEMEEGCLSVRWLYGKVKRSTQATIEAYDEKGKKFTRGASGILAQIFQHEVDHLDGVLFTDRASKVWEMSEEEIGKISKA